jgi:hypothetical protein
MLKLVHDATAVVADDPQDLAVGLDELCRLAAQDMLKVVAPQMWCKCSGRKLRLLMLRGRCDRFVDDFLCAVFVLLLRRICVPRDNVGVLENVQAAVCW